MRGVLAAEAVVHNRAEHSDAYRASNGAEEGRRRRYHAQPLIGKAFCTISVKSGIATPNPAPISTMYPIVCQRGVSIPMVDRSNMPMSRTIYPDTQYAVLPGAAQELARDHAEHD